MRDRGELAWLDVADEMNDPRTPGDPGDPGATLDDLDPAVLTLAQRYAQEHGLAWPPGVGDLDRYLSV